MTRRNLLAAGSLLALRSIHANPAPRFPLAVCSETFEGKDFAESCRLAKKTGYDGIEVAPSHLADDPAAIPASRRRDFRRMIADAGLRFVGTHSLLSAPQGLHITSPDNAIRDKSWVYFQRLIDLTGDLGENSVMVLGSSKQRAAMPGHSVAEAMVRLETGLVKVAQTAQ